MKPKNLLPVAWFRDGCCRLITGQRVLRLWKPLLDRFLGEGTSSKRHDDDNDDGDNDDDSDDDDDDAGDEDLERKKETESGREIKQLLPAPDKNWGLEELLKYKAFMQRLKAKVDSKIDDMKRRETNN